MLDKAENARISVNTMIEPVAEALGNTVAMSRKAYVHPALIAAVKERPRDPLGGMERPRARKWLSSCEVGVDPVPARSGETKRRNQPPLDRDRPRRQDTGDGNGSLSPSGSKPTATGLLIGLLVGVALVALMLLLRSLGRSAIAPRSRTA